MSLLDALLLWIAGVCLTLGIWIAWIVRAMNRKGEADMLAILQAYEAGIKAREGSKGKPP